MNMKMLEDEVSQRVIIHAAECGTFLLRNNSGVLKNRENTPVRYGLGNVSQKQNEKFKSSDQIGITPIVITQDMVGQTVGVFTAIEMKKEGWKFSVNDEAAVAQENFIKWVTARGGRAGFCQSIDDFNKIMGL